MCTAHQWHQRRRCCAGGVNTRCPERVLRIIKESYVLVFLAGVFVIVVMVVAVVVVVIAVAAVIIVVVIVIIIFVIADILIYN